MSVQTLEILKRNQWDLITGCAEGRRIKKEGCLLVFRLGRVELCLGWRTPEQEAEPESDCDEFGPTDFEITLSH